MSSRRSLPTFGSSAALCATLFFSTATAAETLPAKDWARGDRGVVIVQANWGRQWPCAEFENAQLVAIEFRQVDASTGTPPARLELRTPGMLRVDNRFISYAYLLPPGTYALVGFEIKAARSARDVGRVKVEEAALRRDGREPGSFRIGAGEIVYVGGFGLDCTHEPMPWRYYLESRQSFEEQIAAFRQRYPFTAETPVRYRLFESDLIAQPPQFPEGQEPPMELPANLPGQSEKASLIDTVTPPAPPSLAPADDPTANDDRPSPF